MFSPAIALLDRLKYPYKFALISLIFVLPLTLVLVLLLGEVNDRISFTQHEIQGNAYLRPLRQLMEHVPRAQLAAQAAANGDTTALAEIRQHQEHIDHAFVELAVMQQRYGADFGTAEQFENLSAIRQQFALELENPALVTSKARHDQFIDATRALMRYVGDQSNLILDNNLDSYYLMEGVLIQLPESQNLVADILLESNLLREHSSPYQRAHLFELMAVLQANGESAQQDMRVALRSTKNEHLDERLRPALDQMTNTSDEFRVTMSRVLVGETSDALSQYQNVGRAVLNANFALWDDMSAELDRLLQTRVDIYERQRTMVLAFAACALIAVLYLLIGFYRSVMHTVEQLRETAQRLVTGEGADMVALSSRDELSEVAVSFNRIAGALLSSSAHREAIVENALDAIITIDADGMLLSMNSAAERIFGYSAPTIAGQSITTLIPDYNACAQQRGAARYETIGHRSDGSEFPLEIAVNSIALEGQPLVIGIARDLTQQKQAEAEREQMQRAIIDAQAQALKELATPLIPIADDILVMPLVGAIDTQRAELILATLLQGIEQQRVSTAIIDVTGIPVIDTQVAHSLIQAAYAAQLLGARVALTGIRPEVAQTLVMLGVDLSQLVTRSSLQEGIGYALHSRRTNQRRDGSIALTDWLHAEA